MNVVAGHRKRAEKPMTRTARIEARAELCAARIAAGGTWTDRLGPALDHVRAGLVRLGKTDPRAADAVAEPIVRLLIQVSRDLDRNERTGRR